VTKLIAFNRNIAENVRISLICPTNEVSLQSERRIARGNAKRLGLPTHHNFRTSKYNLCTSWQEEEGKKSRKRTVLESRRKTCTVPLVKAFVINVFDLLHRK